MANDFQLKRFIEAQEHTYDVALSEIKAGRKKSHWVWFIFPQIQGLGFSETARYYAIKDLNEATVYLHHPILGERFIRISNALLHLKTSDAHGIFGSPDDLKLKSSMTLFSSIENANPVFPAILEKFFGGAKDPKTLRILKSRQ